MLRYVTDVIWVSLKFNTQVYKEFPMVMDSLNSSLNELLLAHLEIILSNMTAILTASRTFLIKHSYPKMFTKLEFSIKNLNFFL